MATGTLIAESIRPGASLGGLALLLTAIERVQATDLSAEQRAAGVPGRWTLLRFEIGDDRAADLARTLAGALDDVGWYVDLHTARESFVVFADRVFRYPRGDRAGRAEAASYARSRGVPEAQIDWP